MRPGWIILLPKQKEGFHENRLRQHQRDGPPGTSAKAGGPQHQPNAAIHDAHEPAKGSDTAAAAGTAEPSCSATTGREARPHFKSMRARTSLQLHVRARRPKLASTE